MGWRLVLKPWLFLFLLGLYVGLGAYFLSAEEWPRQQEEKWLVAEQSVARRREMALNATLQLVNTSDLVIYLDSKRSDQVLLILDNVLAEFEVELRLAREELEWNYPNALLYALSLVSTLGHSGLRPRSFNGKIFAFGLTLVGVPLLLASVGELARLLFRLIELCYIRCQPPDDDSVDNNLTYNMAKPPAYCKLVLPLFALVGWTWACAGLLFYVPTPPIFPTIWDAVMEVFMSFCTVELPRIPTESALPLIASAIISLVFVSLVARLLGAMCEDSEPLPLPRDQSATLSGLSLPRTLPISRSQPKQLEVSWSGEGSVVRSWGVREDERVWMAEATCYAEPRITPPSDIV